MDFTIIEPYFKKILKDLHGQGLIYMNASDRQIWEAYNRVRANGKKANTPRLPVHGRGYGLL